MTYNGQKDVRLIVITSDGNGSITDERELLDKIRRHARGSEYEAIRDGAEIDVIEFNIINNNNTKSSSSFAGTMYYSNIYQIYYRIIMKEDKVVI
jgi:hypothetical protein